MIVLLSLIAGGTTLIVDPTHPPAKPLQALPYIQVRIAKAPGGVTLPILVESRIIADGRGGIAECSPITNSGSAAFATLACRQIQTLMDFPIDRDEMGRPIKSMWKITVTFDVAR